MQDVTVTKYERERERSLYKEYFFKIGLVPGGRIVKVFFVPSDAYDIDEATAKVVDEIKEYLKDNNYNAITKF